MSPSRSPGDTVPPEEAFSVLGNETRVEILRVLGQADEPMTFTSLREAVGLRQGGQFNYHLDKLVGHFVKKGEDGYELRKPGRGIVEAVYSGAVTEDPEIEPTPVDFDCLLCGAQIKISYRAERVELYCSSCAGQYGERVTSRPSSFETSDGNLGGYQVPPAGVSDREPEELLHASSLITHLENVALANGVCPRCGGTVDVDLIVCKDHDRSNGRCPECDDRHAVQLDRRCTNCHFQKGGMAINILATRLELRQFVAEQGIDPIVEGYKWGWDCEETVLSLDPFRGEFTFEVDGASITFRTDENLAIEEVVSKRKAETNLQA